MIVWSFRLCWSFGAIVAVVKSSVVLAVLLLGIAILYLGERTQ